MFRKLFSAVVKLEEAHKKEVKKTTNGMIDPLSCIKHLWWLVSATEGQDSLFIRETYQVIDFIRCGDNDAVHQGHQSRQLLQN